MTNYKNIPEINDYIKIVKEAKKPISKYQVMLVSWLENIFLTETLTIDTVLLGKYMSMQKYFPFKLFPWEKFVFALCNCTFREDGNLRFPDLFACVSRGAGKNGYLSFENFCLIGPYNPVPRYDIDMVATTEKQAKTSFQDIYDILEFSEYKSKLKKHFYWNKTEIIGKKNRSKFSYHTSNAKSKDGLRSAKVDFDEIHQFENYEIIKVFTTGLGKKKHPRRSYTTTNGDISDGVLDDMLAKSREILEGKRPDNGLLPFICMLDSKEEYKDPKNWHKPNPSLEYLPTLYEETMKEYLDYQESPEENADFMTKRMNWRYVVKEMQLTDWDNIEATNRPIDMDILSGKTCAVGIDYTMINDMASVVAIFKHNGEIISLQHSWLCLQSADIRRIKFDYRQAAEKGEITLVDELEIPAWMIAEYVAQLMCRYNVVRVAMDNYRYALLREALMDIGIEYDHKKKIDEQTLQLVRPSDKEKVEPIIDSWFRNQLLVWGDCMTMRWCANNTKRVKVKRTGNHQYQKIEAKSRKTDAFMAFVHAATQHGKIPEEGTTIIDIGAIIM